MKKRDLEMGMVRFAIGLGMAACLLAATLVFSSCGINPMEGDYGVVKWVPEEKDCMVYRRATPTRYERVPGKCEGRGHDVEVFGKWRY